MIKNPDAFQRNKSAGFNGVFNWDYLKGAFPRDIDPTDWDAVVEINGRFLVFETKDPGKNVEKGQARALRAATKTGLFSVVILWGKSEPMKWERWTRTKDYRVESCTRKRVFNWAKKWADWADKQVDFESDCQIKKGPETPEESS